MAQTDRCIIVGSGPSARGFVPPDGIPIISVKRTITWLPRADYWFSLDNNETTTNLVSQPREGTTYYAAVPEDFPLPPWVIRMKRIAARNERQPRPLGSPLWWLWRWRCVRTLCEEPGAIHTGNSAWGALGLAYHLGFRDVLLVGVDGTQDARIEGGHPNNLSHLPLLFQSAMNQVRLRSVGNLRGIPRATVEEWLRESVRD